MKTSKNTKQKIISMATDEPSMDEILGSIRRILSKDDDNLKTDDTSLMREWAAMAGDGSYDDEDDDDKHSMAAEWEAMLGGDYERNYDIFDKFDVSSCATPTMIDTTRVLNQDEIDSLLGFDDVHSPSDKSGVQSIINSTLISYERLPVLENIIRIFIEKVTPSLRKHFNDNIELSLDNILSLRMGDYKNSIPLPAMFQPNYSPELCANALFVFDSSLVYSTVDVLLGGRRGTAAMRIEGRPYTIIERELVQTCFDICNEKLGESFQNYSGVTFLGQEIDVNPRSINIATNEERIIVAKIHINMEDRGGRMELVIPYSTLEPILPILRQQNLGARYGNDKIWHSAIENIIPHMPVDVNVKSPTYKVKIRDIENLVEGDILMTDMTLDDFIFTAGNKDIGKGSLCKKNNKFAIALNEIFVEVENEDGTKTD
jgi:flagellar motor switch protein FliM